MSNSLARASELIARSDGDRPNPRRATIVPYLIWLLVLVSLVSWRRDVFFTGAIDPVVVVKAVIGGGAFLLAALPVRHSSIRAPLGAGAIVLVLFYVALATVGGYAADSLLPAAVVSIRVLLIAATIALLVRRFPARTVF